jgi:hypothetical protein
MFHRLFRSPPVRIYSRVCWVQFWGRDMVNRRSICSYQRQKRHIMAELILNYWITNYKYSIKEKHRIPWENARGTFLTYAISFSSPSNSELSAIILFYRWQRHRESKTFPLRSISGAKYWSPDLSQCSCVKIYGLFLCHVIREVILSILF